ncbi:hypothetical protein BMS3Abin04_02736 [bacterium BMS3Abin04]|nr:hypothetical protein BMS3Abin04_02736 [bacterium BMS3Abin04]
MEQVTLEKVNEIAQTYFGLLIERHKKLGFKVDIIEEDNLKKNEQHVFYLRFTNSANECKLYKIMPYVH